MARRQRSWWGWGWADAALDDRACAELAERRVAGFLPLDGRLTPVPAVPALPPPRLRVPSTLAPLLRTDDPARAAHAYGKAYRDVVRALNGVLDHPPDAVAYPASEADVAAVLDWAGSAGVPVVAYGGGTSVVGGVEYRGGDPWLSLDVGRLDRVVAVDEVNRAVCVQGGTLGPALEDGLRRYDLTLRHYPQSFEFSTVGGWLATRAGGHFATGQTRIDDLVEAVRAVTPIGVSESLRVPGSGAGPAPDRLLLGSEGTLGVITQAWLRVRPRPRFTAATTVRFRAYPDGVAASRAVLQAGLLPANCRLLDPLEAMLNVGADDGTARLLLAFESADHPVDALLGRAVQLCREHRGEPEPARSGVAARTGGTAEAGATEAGATEAGATAAGATAAGATAAAWRSAFLRAPYLRDALARLGLVVETVETACTWDRFEELHAAVAAAAATAAPAGAAIVTCRFTHVYPDGPAPYFTVVAPGRRGAEAQVWDEIKASISAAIMAAGGTITHHHAVGRDHRPWYDRQRPEPFAQALRAAKSALDPAGVLNPGVLLDCALSPAGREPRG